MTPSLSPWLPEAGVRVLSEGPGDFLCQWARSAPPTPAEPGCGEAENLTAHSRVGVLGGGPGDACTPTHAAAAVHTQVLASLSHRGHFPLQPRKLSSSFCSEAPLVPRVASARHHAQPQAQKFSVTEGQEGVWSVVGPGLFGEHALLPLPCLPGPASGASPSPAGPPIPLSQWDPGREGTRSLQRWDVLVRIWPFLETSLHLDKFLCAGLLG